MLTLRSELFRRFIVDFGRLFVERFAVEWREFVISLKCTVILALVIKHNFYIVAFVSPPAAAAVRGTATERAWAAWSVHCLRLQRRSQVGLTSGQTQSNICERSTS